MFPPSMSIVCPELINSPPVVIERRSVGKFTGMDVAAPGARMASELIVRPATDGEVAVTERLAAEPAVSSPPE
jgi:hypothetical protein